MFSLNSMHVLTLISVAKFSCPKSATENCIKQTVPVASDENEAKNLDHGQIPELVVIK
jgi:hypothetical protein